MAQVKTLAQQVSMKTMEAVRGFFGILRHAGYMFGGARDIYSAYGYDRRIHYLGMKARYERQDIASRIIDMPADAIWTDPPEVGNLGKFETMFTDMVEDNDLWQIFNRADKLSGMGAYSAILVGLTDGQKLDVPVQPGNSNLKVAYLQPYGEMSMLVEQVVNDNMNPRFGKPEFYLLKATNIMATGRVIQNVAVSNSRVHHSRIIHVAESVLEDEVYGHPRLAQVYNLLDDFLKVGGGSAEVYWLNARAGLHVDIDKEMQVDPTDESALTDEVDEYINNMRRVIRTRGVKVNTLNTTLADPRGTFAILLSLLSAATGIPQRILIGSEAGQLASAQDRANWASYVQQRRINYAEPRVLKPFFRKMTDYGFMDKKDLKNITLDWPEAFKLSPLERSQTSAQQARSAANLSKTLVQTPELLSQDSCRQIISLAMPGDILKPGKKGKVTPTTTAPATPGTSKPANGTPANSGGG